MRVSFHILVWLVLGFVVGCSDVAFESVPSETCSNFGNGSDQDCQFGSKSNTYSVTFRTGQVDILFVDDNSGSMSPEQTKVANAFSGFLNQISALDYQIGITTTDVVNNDGRLLQFSDEQGVASGEYLLKKATTNALSKFRGTIQRKETLKCDQSGYKDCPSSDERGIYAMNLVVERNDRKLLRPGAHLAIIALSDEDQRGQTAFDSTSGKWKSAAEQYGVFLEAKDYPETLVKTMSKKYPSKTLSVHSVIVKPGDSTCLSTQVVFPAGAQSPLRGFYGNLYNQLSQATQNNLDDLGQIVNGSVVSICKSDYYTDLNLIGALVEGNADEHSIKMVCLPELEDIAVESSVPVDYHVNEQTKTIEFGSLPMGVEVRVSYKCPKSV